MRCNASCTLHILFWSSWPMYSNDDCSDTTIEIKGAYTPHNWNCVERKEQRETRAEIASCVFISMFIWIGNHPSAMWGTFTTVANIRRWIKIQYNEHRRHSEHRDKTICVHLYHTFDYVEWRLVKSEEEKNKIKCKNRKWQERVINSLSMPKFAYGPTVCSHRYTNYHFSITYWMFRGSYLPPDSSTLVVFVVNQTTVVIVLTAK